MQNFAMYLLKRKYNFQKIEMEKTLKYSRNRIDIKERLPVTMEIFNE